MQLEFPIEEIRKRSLFLGLPAYGGNMAATTAHSLMQLSAMCTQYGIMLKPYFLMNESLVQRARNYITDEYLRSDCTHLMFIDGDISFNPNDVIALLALSSDESPYDVICGPYPKKSLPSTAKIVTENGKKTIKWLVDNKYTGKVLTLNDKTGKTEWNNVIQHFKNPNEGKWLKLIISKHTLSKQLICTYDHEIMLTDNPLVPTLSYVRADQSVGKYVAIRPRKSKDNLLYSKEVSSAMIGSMFGDAHISKKSNRLSVGHCKEQREYIEFKQTLFGGKLKKYISGGYSKCGEHFLLTSPVNEQTKFARELFYKDDNKTVKYALEHLDEIGLAFWYMDDGCLKKSGNTSHYCELNTQGFSDEDQDLMVEWFNKKYGFDVKVDIMRPAAKSKTELSYKRLRLKNKDSAKFLNIIAKYIPECMEYKLPVEYQNITKHSYDIKRLDYALAKVENSQRLNLGSDQYDIGVENNHNFVTDDVHVSNCISWEKIKMGVDKGFADEDPNNLQKLVGDFVFNTVNSGPVKLNEPVEVLESGTGFMMIRRKTFEKYKEAYPQYSYLPDHVRTEHFDGTREIMAYFDCSIDPVSKRYLSEDYHFCQHVRKAGMKVWLAPWIVTGHLGTYNFGGSLADLAAIGSSATADIEQLKKIKKK